MSIAQQTVLAAGAASEHRPLIITLFSVFVAATLVISVKTANVHVSHILHKLGVPNRIEAAAIAHRVAPATIRPGDSHRQLQGFE